MEVTKTMLGEVMNDDQRKEFRPELRKELARKHRLARQLKKVQAEIRDNNIRVAALDLLAGGMGNISSVRFGEYIFEANAYLQANYSHNLTIPKNYVKEFAEGMNRRRPYTEEELDKYSENLVELLEWTSYIDAATFWMYSIYGGDWKLMIDREAEGLGFQRKVL